ncbi:MAG: FIST C-terminal domain-containing protein [Verrucomicrobiae bacterium]|nr:FIST C-terminal domain-containing protein [Verrucomicrobiae bacterium]
MDEAIAFTTNSLSLKDIRHDFQKNKKQCSHPVSLALVFISGKHEKNYREIVALIDEIFQPLQLAGCSSSGVIGNQKEYEDQTAISILLLSLPDLKATIQPVTQNFLDESSGPGFWHYESECSPESVRGVFIFADPFTLRVQQLTEQLSNAYPDTPMIGGMATSGSGEYRTFLFHNQDILTAGALIVFLEGPFQIQTLVSQGCKPIGKPYAITQATENVIHCLDDHSALFALTQLFTQIDNTTRKQIRNNLYLGLAVHDYPKDFQLGDFLIHNIIGINEDVGSLVIGIRARDNQMVQFHMRDPHIAFQHLHFSLQQLKSKISPSRIKAALLCLCNGRGKALYGKSHTDVRFLEKELGSVPLTGFFCNGEIGPMGNRVYVHGYTACAAFFVSEN